MCALKKQNKKKKTVAMTKCSSEQTGNIFPNEYFTAYGCGAALTGLCEELHTQSITAFQVTAVI